MSSSSDFLQQLNELQRQVRQTIKDHGWAGIGIYDDPNRPGYTYSAGIWKTARRPEVIVFGLKHELSTKLIWSVYHLMKNKKVPAIGVPHTEVIKPFSCYLFSVDRARYPGLISVARSIHGGSDFPCLQLVYPDPQGRFPWGDRCESAYRDNQPDLSENGWKAELAN